MPVLALYDFSGFVEVHWYRGFIPLRHFISVEAGLRKLVFTATDTVPYVVSKPCRLYESSEYVP